MKKQISIFILIIVLVILSILFLNKNLLNIKPQVNEVQNCFGLNADRIKGEWLSIGNEEIGYITRLILKEGGSFVLNYKNEDGLDYSKYNASGSWSFEESEGFLKLYFEEGDMSILESRPDNLPGDIRVDYNKRILSIRIDYFYEDCEDREYYINFFNVNLFKEI